MSAFPAAVAATHRTGAPRGRSAAESDADLRATALVDAMAALPAGHPERPALRAAAIEAWLPMAERLTRRYARRGEPFEDLLQAAAVGLIKAVDGYDRERGVEFVGYAIPTVLGEIKRHFRDRTWAVRVPRRLQELRLAISSAQNDLPALLQRAPTTADVADHLGVSEEAVLEALESGHAYRSVSLSSPIDDYGDLAIGDSIGAEDPGFVLAEMLLDLPPAMATLTERERRIVMLRFYGNMTQTCIAEEIGLSQMHVSRLLARALGKLRTRMS